ncbi:protein translocase subunit SecD [Rhodobacterales bacterium HKCCE2091]|nr:protein translocase subunit SecD [Rhodobacterales bacterium HKCCE2091]
MLNIPFVNRIAIILVVLAGLVLAMPNLFYDRVERHNDAVAAIEATGAETDELGADRALWPSFLPSGLVNLGLDLRGGAHLLAEVQLSDVYEARMEGLWPEVRDRLRDERETIGTIRRLAPEDVPPGELHIQISRPENLDAAVAAVRELAQPVASLTGVGASSLDVRGQGDTVIVTLSEAEQAATDERTMRQSLEIIRRRVDEAGTREPTIQRQGEDRILIQVPGLGSAQELKDLIGRPARLTFNPVVGRSQSPEENVPSDQVVYPSAEEEGVNYILERAEVVSGEDLTDAQPSFDQNGRPSVSFRFNPNGARAFCTYTGANVGAPFAIVLDGEVISAPRINEAICGGSGQITGNFSVESSTDLAVLLRSGALPADMVFLEERTIGPELGSDSIEAGQVAAVVALAAVLVFMALSYGLFGIFANVALLLNVAMIVGLLSLFGATLTLPGIAGIVLTIGMAVDANVLVFERIREELKTAKGPARAIELGYERALSAIIDANITTFIVAVILFVMGSGPVRGFSVTLGLGIATSVFTAIFVTRLLIVWWFERRRPKTIEV